MNQQKHKYKLDGCFRKAIMSPPVCHWMETFVFYRKCDHKLELTQEVTLKHGHDTHCTLTNGT